METSLTRARPHAHCPTPSSRSTTLSFYAVWIDGAVETDIAPIRDAMNRTPGVTCLIRL